MPFSSDHQDVTRAVGAQRSSHNPYGQSRVPGDLGDMPPEIFHRVMNAWRTGEKVSDIHADWRAEVEGRREFNAQLRREAGVGGFTGDADAVLSEGDNPGAGAVRDDQTGRYVDLAAEMRASGSKPIPGGLVPSEAPTPPPDMNADIRAAYENAVAQRGTR